MASSCPPPLMPINGSNNIHYGEKNNSAASKPMNRLELQFGEYVNRKSHECFQTINTFSHGDYNQQQSNHYPHQFTMQSQVEINQSESCESTRPNPPENELKQEKSFSHQQIISDIDFYWYRKNLENLNTIYCLRKEITDLRAQLIAAKNHRGNMRVNKYSGRKEKTDKNHGFTCEICRKEYKTERGLEVHQRSSGHADPGC